jgi:ArsR family transcriptional regulator
VTDTPDWHSPLAGDPRTADAAACVCELTTPLELTQPTVSHHLKVLHDAGLVTRSRRGTWVYYRAVPERLAALAGIIAAPISV